MDKELVLAIEKLKEVKRKGWVDSGIQDAESVADHTCSVALCVLFAGIERKDIDIKKALTMALIHDLAESIVGDITPFDGVTRKEKLKKETAAFTKLLGSIAKVQKDELLGLWKELGEGTSKEARLVLDADTFDRLVQAKIYRDKGQDVDRFFGAISELSKGPFEGPLGAILRISFE